VIQPEVGAIFLPWLFITHHRLHLCLLRNGNFDVLLRHRSREADRVSPGQHSLDALISYAVCTVCVCTEFRVNCLQMSQQSLDNKTHFFMYNCCGGGGAVVCSECKQRHMDEYITFTRWMPVPYSVFAYIYCQYYVDLHFQYSHCFCKSVRLLFLAYGLKREAIYVCVSIIM
jgi:hypothetical protein